MDGLRVTLKSKAAERATEQDLADVPPIYTEAELREVMASRQYQESAVVRELVARAIAKSDPLIGTQALNTHEVKIDRRAENAEMVRDWVTTAMRDPRYRTSALYRDEVKQKIAAMQAQGEGDGLSVRPNQTNRVSITGVEGAPVRTQSSGVTRISLPPKITGPYRPGTEEAASEGRPGDVDFQ